MKANFWTKVKFLLMIIFCCSLSFTCCACQQETPPKQDDLIITTPPPETDEISDTTEQPDEPSPAPAVTELSYYDQKINAFKLENDHYSQGQIIFIGDSITNGFHLDDYFTDLPLATYNRGIDGDTTFGVLARLQVSLYDLEPSKIVLMIGVNDINGRRDLDEIVADYTKIVASIRTTLPTTQLYLMSLISQHEQLTINQPQIDIKDTIPDIQQLNPKIQDIATEYSAEYIDLYSLTIDAEQHLMKSYSDDGLHLNQNGHAVWASLIKPYLI